MISPHAAIIYSMVLSAAADGDLANDEITTIKTIINGLPVFDGFDSTKFNEIAGACTDLLTEDDGWMRQLRLYVSQYLVHYVPPLTLWHVTWLR